MADNKERSDIQLKLPGLRICFVDALFEAKAFKGGDKKRFSSKFLIPKESPLAAQVKAAIAQAAKNEFGDAADKELRIMVAENKICLTDGDIKGYEGYAGNYVLSASNKTRPTILVPGPDGKLVQASEKDGKIYSGCYVHGIFSLWAQNNDFGKRINCNLQGVQFFRDGDAFSGGSVASVDEFSGFPQDTPATTTFADNNSSFM